MKQVRRSKAKERRCKEERRPERGVKNLISEFQFFNWLQNYHVLSFMSRGAFGLAGGAYRKQNGIGEFKMELIGQGTEDNWIASISSDEIANIMGKYSHFHDEFKMPKIGMQFKISELFDNIVHQFEISSEIASAIKMLRVAADVLEGINPVVLPSGKE